MKERHLAAPVKLWAMMCALAGYRLRNVLLTCILALTGVFMYGP